MAKHEPAINSLYIGCLPCKAFHTMLMYLVTGFFTSLSVQTSPQVPFWGTYNILPSICCSIKKWRCIGLFHSL